MIIWDDCSGETLGTLCYDVIQYTGLQQYTASGPRPDKNTGLRYVNSPTCTGLWTLVPRPADTLTVPEEALATEASREAVVGAGWSSHRSLAGGLGARAALTLLPLLVATALFGPGKVQVFK